MAKFLKGNELNSEVGKIIEHASEQLLLISPYIKLHHRYADALREKINEDELEITVVFGKNEENLSKSISEADIDFFTQFPNVEIRYEKRLHAKYYANESKAILTSMNMYSFSQDNNIEAGVMTNSTLLKSIGNTLNVFSSGDDLDKAAFDFFHGVIERSELLFRRKPKYKSSMMGLHKEYIDSDTDTDTDKLYTIFEPDYKTRKKEKAEKTGYCIRTGSKIPFNVEKPLSIDAYKSWERYGDPNYPEKHCHFSGESSNGETSVSKPIMKNWKKAKEVFAL